MYQLLLSVGNIEEKKIVDAERKQKPYGEAKRRQFVIYIDVKVFVLAGAGMSLYSIKGMVVFHTFIKTNIVLLLS